MGEVAHAQRAHAKYSGSNVHRFRRCPGQARYARRLNRESGSSADAEEGTLVHELIEIAVNRGIEAAAEDERWTEERGAAVALVLRYLDGLRAEYLDLEVFTERKVYFPQSIVEPDDACGLADLTCISAGAGHGWLIDYKNGVRPVDHPSENDQLWYYATAAFWSVPIVRFTTVIIQPNGLGVPPIREYTAPAYEMIAFQALLEQVIAGCEKPDAPLVTGDWCSEWSVGAECPTREAKALEELAGAGATLDTILLDGLPAAEGLPAERWAYIRRVSGFIRSWLADVDKAAVAYAMKGGKIPGEKLVQAGSKREWDGTPEETADGLSALIGRPPATFLVTKPIGITEAERLLKIVAAKAPDPDGLREKFAILCPKGKSGGLSLVPESDPRPAYNAAASAFQGIVPENLIGEK